MTRAASQPADGRPRIGIVWGWVRGFYRARWLPRRFASSADVVLPINPVDHMVYSALLPDVVGGVVDPACIATPLAASLGSATVLVGTVRSVDTAAQTCIVRAGDGEAQRLTSDCLELNAGSVTDTFGIAGVEEYARGFKTIAEAIYLRERILRYLWLADSAPQSPKSHPTTAASLENRETGAYRTRTLDSWST